MKVFNVPKRVRPSFFLIRRVRARTGLSFPFIHSRVTYLP